MLILMLYLMLQTFNTGYITVQKHTPKNMAAINFMRILQYI